MEAFAVVVEELVLAILDDGALDLLDGLVALRNLHAVADAAHVDLGGRGALAGMEAFGGQNDVELAVDVENIALADGAGDNLHRCYSSWLRRPGRSAAPVISGRTILILAGFASIFAPDEAQP